MIAQLPDSSLSVIRGQNGKYFVYAQPYAKLISFAQKACQAIDQAYEYAIDFKGQLCIDVDQDVLDDAMDEVSTYIF